MTKKLSALLLAALMVLALFAGCKPNTEGKPSDGQETPSQGQEEPTPSGGEESKKPSVETKTLAELKTLAVQDDQDAYAAAMEAKQLLLDEYETWMDIIVPQITMPINAKYSEGKKVLEALAVQKEELEDENLYCVEYYHALSSELNLGGTYGIYRNKVRVARMWAQENDGGWYTQNINTNGMYLREDMNTETDLLDDNSDISDAYKDVLRQIIAKHFRANYITPKDGVPYCRYLTVTTDAETRAFEQVFYDVSGFGVTEDLSENENPYAIELDGQYSKREKEDMDESLRMIRDVYNSWAEEHPSLKTYADRYAAYVEKLIAG